jgi:D-serine deaminase-like pyridoxal phosphate-dependent protein
VTSGQDEGADAEPVGAGAPGRGRGEPGEVDPERVETPVGTIDLERVRANARAVSGYAAEHGFRWRPHIKTHKSRRIAALQLEAGAHGLTVATPREAEVMAALTGDVLLAYPPVGREKVDRVVRLADAVDLKVALDSAAVLRPLATAAASAGVSVGIVVELDVGLGRVGVPGAAEVLDLARLASDLEGVSFRGIQFYPGHIRDRQEEQGGALRRVSEQVGAVLDALRDEGLRPEIVSGGSTPTLWRSHEIQGLTEIRSGSCIFFDREGLELGVIGADRIAYTVLATVISTAVPGRAVIDAGSKALSKEERGGSGGYGFLMEHPEVLVASLSEEHGVLDLGPTEWRPSVGDRVRVVPNHVCVSVNLQDALLASDGAAHEWISLEGRGRGPWSD